MKWYLAKLVFRIISGEGDHTPQFDEQLRLLTAENEMHAFQKARILGDKEEDNFLNNDQLPVQWRFIDVSELRALNELVDGTEIYSCIKEEDDAEDFVKITNRRANYLHERCLEKTFEMS